MRNLKLLSFCLALFLLRASCANGRIVIFGDSLSDNGNSYAASNGQVPPSPYGTTYNSSGVPGEIFPGRFTDGKNWVDYIPGVGKAFGLNIPAVTAYLQDPQNDNATNFAVGGSTSGNVNVLASVLPGFPAQISTYLASLGEKSSADDLCVIWIGANDFSAGIDPAQTVANIKDGIAKLSENGVRSFVVINIPDLSLTPTVMAKGGPTILAAKRFVITTNVLLEIELLRFAFLHRISIEVVNINAIFVPLVLNPVSFGFTNSTGSALAALEANLRINPNTFVFWDGFHPTTKVHHIAAEFIFNSVFLRRPFHESLSVR
jgi:phospholipase/lecithinase/hemolysin